MTKQISNTEELDFSFMSPAEAAHNLAEAEATVLRQAHMIKASEAYCRLSKTDDFKLVLAHLKNTAGQLALDLSKRSAEAQAKDVQVIGAISTVVALLNDMPSLVGRVQNSKDDTERAVAALRKAL